MLSQKELEKVLLTRGYLQAEQLVKAKQIQAKNKESLEIVLLKLNYVTRQDLEQIQEMSADEDLALDETFAPAPSKAIRNQSEEGLDETFAPTPIGKISPQPATAPPAQNTSTPRIRAKAPPKTLPKTPTSKKSSDEDLVCASCGFRHVKKGPICLGCHTLMHPPNAKDKLAGKTIADRFQLNGKLGAGGMGMVYHAKDLKHDKYIAVKLLPMQLNTDEAILKRFQREAEVQVSLKHPNIVGSLDYGVEEDFGCYLAMDLLIGQDFKDYQKKHLALSASDIMKFFGQVCDAMHYTHAQGVVHRDLKPANIFLQENDKGPLDGVKIIDFGIAKLTDEEVNQLTLTGMFMGTPTYMSPEQASGSSKNIDARSDIYTLGVILFEVLTGRPPFAADHLAKILMDHIYTPPPQLSQLRPNISFPPRLQAFIDKALAKEVDKRPQTMNDFKEELFKALRDVDANFWGPAPTHAKPDLTLEKQLQGAANSLLKAYDLPLFEGKDLPPQKLYEQLAFRLRATEEQSGTLAQVIVGVLLDQDLKNAATSSSTSHAQIPRVSSDSLPAGRSSAELPRVKAKRPESKIKTLSRRDTNAKTSAKGSPIKIANSNQSEKKQRTSWLFLTLFAILFLGGLGYFVWKTNTKKASSKKAPTRKKVPARKRPPARKKATKAPKKRTRKTRRRRRRRRIKRNKTRRKARRRNKARRKPAKRPPTRRKTG